MNISIRLAGWAGAVVLASFALVPPAGAATFPTEPAANEDVAAAIVQCPATSPEIGIDGAHNVRCFANAALGTGMAPVTYVVRPVPIPGDRSQSATTLVGPNTLGIAPTYLAIAASTSFVG